LYREQKQHCAQDETKHVYFSFFNLLKVNDELEIESFEFMGAKSERANSPWRKTGINPYGRRKNLTNPISSKDRLHPILWTCLHLQGIQAER